MKQNACGYSGYYYGWGWSTFILPYLEQRNIYKGIGDFSGQYYEKGNREAGANVVQVYVCPSDPKGGVWVECCSGFFQGSTDVEDFRSSSMTGVADSIDWTSNTLFVGEITGAHGSHPSQGPAYPLVRPLGAVVLVPFQETADESPDGGAVRPDVLTVSPDLVIFPLCFCLVFGRLSRLAMKVDIPIPRDKIRGQLQYNQWL